MFVRQWYFVLEMISVDSKSLCDEGLGGRTYREVSAHRQDVEGD